VIAFVGRPHRIGDRKSQLKKSLRDIGFDQYLLAEEKGWVLYVEDSTDLGILQAFARVLGHEAETHLERPFVKYVETNLPQRARDHFHGLREAKEDLVGIAIFDRLERDLQSTDALVETMWRRREIENYFCSEGVLLRYASDGLQDDLFGIADRAERETDMKSAIDEVVVALATLGKASPWSVDSKVTDEFLEPVFKKFFAKRGMPLELRKAAYHRLAALMPVEELDREIVEKLDAIVAVASRAKPRV